MSSKRSAGPSVRQVPAGDTRTRLVCPDCGYIEYANPKVVVGAVCVWQGRILLCRRAIEPQKGFWTIPAGFLELSESTAEGAMREVWEEARATATVESLLGIYEIPRISQVQMIYRATMTSPDFAAGEESQAVDLFTWANIPWLDLAFPSVSWALRHYRRGGNEPVFATAPNRE